MCNLYSVSTNQEAIRAITRALRDVSGNLPDKLDVYPDRPAPVVRNALDGSRELATLTWGMPTPKEHVTEGKPDKGVTNIRRTFIPHWRQWLGVQNRCVVPATSFSEYEQHPDPETGKKPLRWFALDESKPLFFFAGIWTSWTGDRGPVRDPRRGHHELFGFLTTDANDVVRPIHPKAMPVILTSLEEIEGWLTKDWSTAKQLQRPIGRDQLTLLSRSE